MRNACNASPVIGVVRALRNIEFLGSGYSQLSGYEVRSGPRESAARV